MSKKAEKAEAERIAKILADAKDKKERYLDHWQPIYDKTEKHREFTLLGKQLSDSRKGQLGLTDNALQPNLLLTYANHEANKTLQTDYRGKVSPNGGGSNEISARERQDVLRGLMRLGNFSQIANQVRRDQICGGIAYSIKVVDYAGKRGFGKTLKDEFLEDYQNVLPDMETKTPTMDDARDFFYKKEVPKSAWETETGEAPDNWGNEKKKDLWYYWCREDVNDTEYLMDDGTTKLDSKMEDEDRTRIKTAEDDEPLSRPTTDYSWVYYKIDAEFTRIFEETEWKGSYSPLIACTGRRITAADGQVYYQPLTEFAEEAQELYTIIENIIAMRLSMSPFSRWKIAVESMNIKDEKLLNIISQSGKGNIWYQHLAADGKTALPPPEEIQAALVDEALVNLQQEQRVKIQQIFGIFDANLGEKSNEQSGVAIERRAQGGDLSNFDLQFTYMEWVKQVSRVTLDLIPKYLTAPQQLAFVDMDDNAVMKWVNTTGGVQFSPDEEYSLSIEALPVSPTAREDEAISLMNMAKAMPMIAENPEAVALIVQAQPGRYAQQIAGFIANGDPKMKQAQAMIQELQGKLQQVTQQATAKQQQDAMTIAGLKQAMAGLKMQQAIMKQAQAAQGQTAEARQAMQEMSDNTESTLALLQLQVDQYVAESGRISAEAAMLKVAGDIAKPEPATPAPGQGLP